MAVTGFLRWVGVELGVGKLLAVCDVRDEVIVSLGVCEGLRRGEMAALELADVDLDGQVLFVRGKGGAQRWTPLTKATRVRVERYLDQERGCDAGPLFKSRRNLVGMTATSIGRRSLRLMKAAGIHAPGVNLHALRHTAATRLWMETSDLFMTQQLLGHASIRTTAMYVKSRPSAEMRDAMNRCST
jgi:integrase